MTSTPIALPDSNRGIDPVLVEAARMQYLSGSIGAWKPRPQTVGCGVVVIASPVGDFISFDFSN
ncbi:MAG: hypothetical protein IH859_04940 [Chloroflexi bacterium]|nr:hypothetical protein [Chloroflexota bacterium]